MQTTIDLMKHVISTELGSGKYLGLFFLGLLLLWHFGKKELFWYGAASAAAAFFPVVVYLFTGIWGISSGYWELLWILPLLLVISGAAVLLVDSQQGKRRYAAILGCLILIAGSGTLLPYKGAAVKVKYSDRNVKMAIEEIVHLQEKQGETIVLLAPEEIMADARRYSSGIEPLYGRDLWKQELNTGVADYYPAEYQILYERMKTDYQYPEEMADQAKLYGCNVVVLRQEIPENSGAYQEWKLAGKIPGYVIYQIFNSKEL